MKGSNRSDDSSGDEFISSFLQHRRKKITDEQIAQLGVQMQNALEQQAATFENKIKALTEQFNRFVGPTAQVEV